MWNYFRRILLIGVLLLPIAPSQHALAQDTAGLFVLIVQLEIVPSELENFKAAITENAQASVRDEPGCREFNVVIEKENASHLLLFEIYENAQAFAAHQASPHFKQYAAATARMIKSSKRVELIAVALNTKAR